MGSRLKLATVLMILTVAARCWFSGPSDRRYDLNWRCRMNEMDPWAVSLGSTLSLSRKVAATLLMAFSTVPDANFVERFGENRPSLTAAANAEKIL